MALEDLRKKFIVDDDALKARLEPILEKALTHCQIHKSGQVLITDSKLSAKNQVKLTLAARAIAAQIDNQFSADVPVAEIAKSTGLPLNQVHARGSEIVREKFAQVPTAGVYRAASHKIEAFLDEISKGQRG